MSSAVASSQGSSTGTDSEVAELRTKKRPASPASSNPVRRQPAAKKRIVRDDSSSDDDDDDDAAFDENKEVEAKVKGTLSVAVPKPVPKAVAKPAPKAAAKPVPKAAASQKPQTKRRRARESDDDGTDDDGDGESDATDDDDDDDAEDDVRRRASAPTTKTAKTTAAAIAVAAAQSVATLEEILPPADKLSFSITFANPLILQAFLKSVCQMLPKDILLYFVHSPEFRGIEVDSLTFEQSAMVVGRLPCDTVNIYSAANARGCKEEIVLVETASLMQIVRKFQGYHSVAMYVTKAEPKLVIAVQDATNLMRYDFIGLQTNRYDLHPNMPPIEYDYELSVPAGLFSSHINDVMREKRLGGGAGTVTLSLVEVTSTRRLLIFAGESVVRMIAISIAPPLESIAAGAGAGAGTGTLARRSGTCVRMEGSPTVDCSLPASCVSLGGIARLKRLVEETFGVKYLHDMVHKMAASVQLTLHMAPGKPLTMQFTLDVKDSHSFVAFVLAGHEKNDS
jgi:hypothetical protein